VSGKFLELQLSTESLLAVKLELSGFLVEVSCDYCIGKPNLMGFSVQNILAVFNSPSIAPHIPVNTFNRTVWNFYYQWRPRNLTYHSISNPKSHPVCPSCTLTANNYIDVICRGLCRLCAHSTRFEYLVLATMLFL
jgi:hypothetical protein